MRSSTMVGQDATVLTSAGRAQLEARLDRSLATLADLAERMSQDGASDADREEHRWLVGHVQDLTRVLQHARDVADVDEDPTVVELGDAVVVEFDDGTVETFALVDPVETSSADGRISVASPLGGAVLGSGVGDRLTVRAPGGSYGCVVRARRRLA